MPLKLFLILILVFVAAGCGSASQDDIVFVSDGSVGDGSAGVGTTGFSGGSSGGTSGTTSETVEQTEGEEEIVVPPLSDPEVTADSSGFEVVEQSQGTAALSNRAIRSFLWKPEAERDGNVVVLVDPVGVVVVATGSSGSETLVDSGPSNDRGTTARGSVPGCRFGQNVIVEFFDSRGRIVPLVNGDYRVQIPDGCNRAEFTL